MPVSTLPHILLAVSGGDEKSFRELFGLYKQQVYAYAMHFTHAAAVSEEIVQDIFLKLWLHKESLGEIDDFEAYLYTITRNLCFDYLKKLAREHAMKRELGRSAVLSEQNVEPSVIYRHYDDLVHKALELLPPQQKKIYTLSFYQGQKHEEIARYLHISRNTVKVHLAKARAAVRNYLSAHLDTMILLPIVLFSAAF